MAKEKMVRRVQVPLLREDDDALREFAHLALEDGQLIRAFWRIGLRHRDEFLGGGSAGGSATSPGPGPAPAPAPAGAAPPTSLDTRRAGRR